MFVRQDLDLPQQLVQSAHALLLLSPALDLNLQPPNVIAIGVPHEAALLRVRDKLRALAIRHSEWSEPDADWGVTALATVALTTEERLPLRQYKLWKPPIGSPTISPCSSTSRTTRRPSKANGEMVVKSDPRTPDSMNA